MHTLERKLKAEQAARIASEERAAIAESRASGLEAEVETLKLTIAQLRRDKFGASSERGARLIDQLELQLAELAQDAPPIAAVAPVGLAPLGAPEKMRIDRGGQAVLDDAGDRLPSERATILAPS